MDIDDLIQDQDKNSGGSADFDQLKEADYKIKSDTEIVGKIKRDLIFPSYEIWLKPSDNLPPDRDPEKSEYTFRLKNEEDHSLLAEMLGSPSLWGPNKKRKVDFKCFKGGVYEYEYTDKVNSDGFKVRKYKYLHNPEYKEFFKQFAFKGEPFDMESNPKAAPSLKYYCGIFVADDDYCTNKKSWRYIRLSQRQFNRLQDFHKEGYKLDSTWFKIRREGSGLNSQYTIIPAGPELSGELEHSYDMENLTEPDLKFATMLSSNAYMWKYLQSYILEMDKILGTNYAEPMKKEYEEKKDSEDSSESSLSSTSTSSIPAAVVNESTSESVPSQSADPSTDSDPLPMDDDDIPF